MTLNSIERFNELWWGPWNDWAQWQRDPPDAVEVARQAFGVEELRRRDEHLMDVNLILPLWLI